MLVQAADADARGINRGDSSIPENYGFTPSNMAGQAWQGTKELTSGLYEMGKDILFPPGATEAEKLKFLAHKYIIDPADEQERKAQTAASPSESVGHSIAAAIPLVGPWAAILANKLNRPMFGGAMARAVRKSPLPNWAAKVIKSVKELGKQTAKGVARATGAADFLRPRLWKKPDADSLRAGLQGERSSGAAPDH